MSEKRIRCPYCFEDYCDEGPCPFCGWNGKNLPIDSVSLVPGTVLKERYELGRILGNGGFGITYLAWDRLFNHKVAVKEYMPSDLSTRGKGETQVTVFSGKKSDYYKKGKTKFLEEARLLAKFEKDPAIVSILDYFEDHGTAYNVMEYIDGRTISAILKERGILSAQETIGYILPIIESLKNVHEQGLIHRDIAPDNIMVTKDGQAKLIDFGSARYAAFNSAEKSLTVMVKQGYSAPEQYLTKGERGSFTDVYAIGATMYRMLTGITPPESLERKTKIMEGDGDSLEAISKYAPNSAYLEPVILDAMNVFVKKRIQNMQEFLERLRSINSYEMSDNYSDIQDESENRGSQENMVSSGAFDTKTLLIDEQANFSVVETSLSSMSQSEQSALSEDNEYHTQYDLPVDEIDDRYTEDVPESSGSKRNKVIWTSIVTFVAMALVVSLCIFIPKHRSNPKSETMEYGLIDAEATDWIEDDSNNPLEDFFHQITEDDVNEEPLVTEIIAVATSASATKRAKSYEVYIDVDSHVASVSGGTTFKAGERVTLTATPEDGYSISGWEGDYTSNSAKVSFDMPSKDVHLVVYSKALTTKATKRETTTEKQYTVTITTDNGVWYVDGAGIYSVLSKITKTFPAGESIKIKAIQESGYKITGWSGDYSSDTDTVSFTMPSRDVVLHVRAARQYRVKVWQKSGISTVNGTNVFSEYYDPGATVTLTAKVSDKSKKYIAWVSGNETFGDGETISFKMPNRDLSIDIYAYSEEDLKSITDKVVKEALSSVDWSKYTTTTTTTHKKEEMTTTSTTTKYAPEMPYLTTTMRPTTTTTTIKRGTITPN